MRNDVLQQVQSTPEQIAQGELDFLKDLIQEHNLVSKVNPTTLDVVMFRIEQGLLTAKEGFEAIQQLSKPNILTVLTTVYNNVETIFTDNGLPSFPHVVQFKDGSSAYAEGKFVGYDALGQFIFEKTSS